MKHKPQCFCQRGFEVDNLSGSCIDINECRDDPCHKTAECRNTVGSYTCSCPANHVGDPYTSGCRAPGTCNIPRDCPVTATCIQGKCRSPCETSSCGKNSKCRVVNRQALCFCPPLTTGDPLVECKTVECDDILSFCKPGFTCKDNSCVNICSIPGTCGANAECNVFGTQQTCTCKSGYTGDPNLGCTKLISCESDSHCPAGEKCSGGICVRKYRVLIKNCVLCNK